MKNTIAWRNHPVKHKKYTIWKLIGPDNQRYKFENLKQFIRDNFFRFDSDDVDWAKYASAKGIDWCPAYGGLRELRPTRLSSIRPRWKGWYWDDGQQLMF